MHWLAPKEEKFFQMLAEQSGNAAEAAGQFRNFLEEYSSFERSERKNKAQLIKNIRNKGNELTNSIIEKLDKTSITPLHKEGIYQIALLLDGIIDLINAAALRFVILGIERIDSYITKLANSILSAVIELNKSISDLKKLKHIKEHYAKIKSIKNEADDIYHEAISELFHFYKNSVDIIKYKEIYELLNQIADKCGELAQVMKRIAGKRA